MYNNCGKICCRSISVDDDRRDDVPVSSIDEVLSTIKSDYEKAYFVTGINLYLYFITEKFVLPSLVLKLIFRLINLSNETI